MKNKKRTLEERLENHPDLKARFERILDIAESEVQGADTADAVEERTIVEVQKLGQEVMEDWATGKVIKEVESHKETHPKAKINKKKRSIGTPPLDRSK